MLKIKSKKRESIFFILAALLFLFSSSVYAETSRLAPSKSVVINEFAPGVVPASLDYYIGTFEAEQEGAKQNYIARTLLYFDISQINDIKNKHISNAYIELGVALEQDFMTDDAYDVSVNKVLEGWTGATWNAQPEFEQNPAATATILGNEKYLINIKNIASEWQINPSFNNGILIKGIDESKSGNSNLKQIESISLVVEFEDSNQCNRNNGICRKECGNDEQKINYGCGFLSGKDCCINGVISSSDRTTATTMPDDGGEIGISKCTGCTDINKDRIVDITDLSTAAKYLGEINADYNLDESNDIVDENDLKCVSDNFGQKTEELYPCFLDMIETCTGCPDINGDGVVDDSDTSIVREHLGEDNFIYNVNTNNNLVDEDDAFCLERSQSRPSYLFMSCAAVDQPAFDLSGWQLEANYISLQLDTTSIPLNPIFDYIDISYKDIMDSESVGAVARDSKGNPAGFGTFDYKIEEEGKVLKATMYNNQNKVDYVLVFTLKHYIYPEELRGNTGGIQLTDRNLEAWVYQYSYEYEEEDGNIILVGTAEKRSKKDSLEHLLSQKTKPFDKAAEEAIQKSPSDEIGTEAVFMHRFSINDGELLWTTSRINGRSSIVLTGYTR